MKKYNKIILYLFLFFIFYVGFIYGLGTYPLLDVDETRYVNMAREMFNTKDFLTLYLNGEYFFEKPPLFFWIECLSFKYSGIVSEFTARLPIVLLSLIPAALLIFICKKVKNDKFAVITTAVLFSSLEYVFMTKIAILDSVLTSFISGSILCYFCTFFVKENNKKYFWVLTYIFSAFAVLAKGLPGLIIPAAVIFVSSIIFRTYKDTVRYSWGIFLFLLITLPWHLIMLKMYGNIFFEEYIIKHHILRFLGSEIINRNQPWYFYILTLLWGLFPHIFILISQLYKVKNIRFNIKNNYSKFIILNFIAVLITLLFFSASGGKLITYILPVYPFFAVIIGSIWFEYIEFDSINIEKFLIFFNCFLIMIIIGLLFVKFILPIEIYENFYKIQIIALIILILFVCINWMCLIKRKKSMIFISVCILMTVISGVLAPQIYKFNYTFGQNDLIRFAQTAKENNYTISTYLTGRKYSLLYYGNQSHVDFKVEDDLSWLKNELDKENHMVIVRNKAAANLPLEFKQKGIKYSIAERINYEK